MLRFSRSPELSIFCPGTLIRNLCSCKHWARSFVYHFLFLANNLLRMNAKYLAKCFYPIFCDKNLSFQCRSVLLLWIILGQGPIALAVGAGWGCLYICFLSSLFSFLSPSLGGGPKKVGCLGFNGPLRQYLSLYQAVSQREGERKEKR